MIIDGTDLILGRLATFVAEKALLGETIDIINSEKVVITGNKSDILAKFKARKDRGIPLKGPYMKRAPELIVKRTIRGMLPYKQEKGNSAYKRVTCHRGAPESLKGKPITVKEADVSKVPNLKYVSVGDISRYLGSK